MRFLFKLIGVVVVLAVLMIAAVFLLPGERIARLASEQFTTATGRGLRITGDVSPTLFPVLGVRTGAIALDNAAWSEDGPMLEADSLSIGVALMPLFSGEVQIREIAIRGAHVRLEKNRDGEANWEFGGTGDTTAEPADASTGLGIPLDFGLDQLRLTDASLSYRDAAAGTDIALGDIDLTATLPKFAGPADVSAKAKYNDQPVSLTAQLANLSAFIDGKVQTVSLKADAAGASLSLSGRTGLSPIAADVEVDASIPDLGPVMRLAGLSPVSLPGGLDRDLGFKGQLIYATEGAGAIFLRGAQVRLGGNPLGVEADLTLSSPLNLTARVSGGEMNFSTLTAGASGSADANAAGWSGDFIDASGLTAINGNVALTARSLNLGLVKLGAIDTRVTLDRARLVADLNQVSAYGGTISGQAVVNGRNGLSLGGDLRASNVALQPLLVDFAETDRLIGSADAQIKYLAIGDTMADLMNSLSGSGAISIGQGELLGLDLAGMLRNLDTSFRGEGSKTVFNAITASLDIEDGIARNDDLNFDAPLVRATGAGDIGIGGQTLDYRLSPVALTGGSGITVPVLISGPWSNLSFRPDLEGLINQNLAEERAALEQKLREEAQTALQNSLGVDLEGAGGDVEQAVQNRVDEQVDSAKQELEQKIEDEVGNALRNLLGDGN